eukprot:TRINITY_DN4678_c0_g1_i11.p1 TRINITY_DN4678_c0_g1~~TRINITY_DN4678_c0_g1_i11.p1  ORF type:complete len:354 (-),score=104.24 TRINITY_DN4678_c0_g1_i11:759-1820(-)
MGLEVVCNEESVKKLEKFLNTNRYKELAENAMSFNRKLNEERKTRLPYVDGQTGVAQRHYDQMRRRQERMPGRRDGQIVSYPQKRWTKKRYQYLHYFMMPKHLRNEMPPPGEAGVQQITKDTPGFQEENSNGKKEDWSEYYDDETYAMQEPIGSEPESDSDFEYESNSRGRRGKKRSAKAKVSTPGGGGRSRRKNQEFDDKPSDRSSRASRRSTGPPPAPPAVQPPPTQAPPPPHPPSTNASDYCDFCLGDASMNKKTNKPEELIACSICGRAGHSTCLQFTPNMKVMVKTYPWQCIECKSCTLCGTSENDDKLLFCDDCDRGYHMYCLTPPIREAPEGSWSCSICIAAFHKK